MLDNLRFFSSTDPHPFLDTSLVLYWFVKTVDNDYLVLDLMAGNDKNLRISSKIESILNGKKDIWLWWVEKIWFN
jgi:hypothetical protein